MHHDIRDTINMLFCAFDLARKKLLIYRGSLHEAGLVGHCTCKHHVFPVKATDINREFMQSTPQSFQSIRSGSAIELCKPRPKSSALWASFRRNPKEMNVLRPQHASVSASSRTDRQANVPRNHFSRSQNSASLIQPAQRDRTMYHTIISGQLVLKTSVHDECLKE